MNRTGYREAIFGSLLLMLLGAGRSPAQYVPDHAFGTTGQLELAEDTVTNLVHGLRLADDSILVLAQVGPVGGTVPDRDILLVKYGPRGTLATDFGQGGMLRFDFDSLAYSTGISIYEDSDGSFLVLGSGKTDLNATRSWGCLQRVSSGGALLPLAPQLAGLRYEVMGLEEYPNAVVQDAGGQYLIAGSTFDPIGNHAQPVVLCYTPGWELDTAFGGTGRVLFDFGATQSVRTEAVHFSGGFIRDAVPRADSGLVICGALSNGDRYVGFVAGIAPDGSLASDFCPPWGYATFDLYGSYDTRIQGIKFLGDGTLAFAGSTHPGHPNPDLLLGRLNPANGTWVHEMVDLGDSQDEFEDMVQRPDGSLVLCATRASEGGQAMALVEVPDAERLEDYSTAIFTPDPQLDLAGHFLLQQTERVLMGGFQRSGGAHIRGILLAARTSATSSTAPVKPATRMDIFPHPIHDQFTLRSSESIREICLYSAQGHLCFQRAGGMGFDTSVELPELPAGSYLLVVNGEWRRKVVVW